MGCSYRLDAELEKLAIELQRELQERGLVGQQTAFLATIPEAFTGANVVSILQGLLPRIATREEALEKGREIMSTFTLFKHALKKDRKLQDSHTDFYQFENNLPSQVQKVKKKYQTLWERAHLLEKHLKCKDRKHMFKTYQNCFVAREAVDVMMQLKLVKSRREGVHLMRKLNEKVFFCEHVCCEHEFKDEYLFFTLIPKSQRMRDPHKKSDSKKPKKERQSTSSRTSFKAPIGNPDSTRKQPELVKGRRASAPGPCRAQ